MRARLVLEAVGIIGGGSRFVPAPRTPLETSEARFDAARAVKVEELASELEQEAEDRARQEAEFRKRCEKIRQRWGCDDDVDPGLGDRNVVAAG